MKCLLCTFVVIYFELNKNELSAYFNVLFIVPLILNTLQYNTIQYNTMQYNNMQYYIDNAVCTMYIVGIIHRGEPG